MICLSKFKPLDYLRRISGYYTIGRELAFYYSPCTYNAIITNNRPFKNQGIKSYPHIIAYNYRRRNISFFGSID